MCITLQNVRMEGYAEMNGLLLIAVNSRIMHLSSHLLLLLKVKLLRIVDANITSSLRC